MSAVAEVLRGPRVARVLQLLGIDPQRYWLLMDLFDQLSERGEVLDQLGRNGVALKTAVWIYFALSCLMTLLYIAVGVDETTYAANFLVFNGVVLLSVLLPETSNSLLNPAEGLVLAHQPINGATYTAAKLTHLARIVFYLALGLNAIPAAAGLLVRGTSWWYPFMHLLAALAAGLFEALLCCALFGWLMRFVPVRRLRAAGQLAAILPMIGLVWLKNLQNMMAHVHLFGWLQVETGARLGLVCAMGVAAVTIVFLGIRSLSADYLIRVSSLMRGGAAGGAKGGKSYTGAIVARLCGGQTSRAGFEFTARMMRRDWQFRRQIVPMMVLPAVGFASIFAAGWRNDPFAGRFTEVHIVPHIFGAVLFFVCVFLPYGSDYQAARMFLLAPSQAFAGFARGIYALLWIIVAVPHIILLFPLAWLWGFWHAGLFVAYSLAVASVYLALELRLVEGAPFSRQADPARGAVALPMMMGGGLVMAIAVGLQYIVVFRSPAIVVAITVALGMAAWFLTRSSLGALEVSIRYHLSLLSQDSGTFYQEIET